MTLAFSATLGSSAIRASTGKISVEKLADRAATLVWTSSSKNPFTIRYGSQGAVFLSRRTVAHTQVKLAGLRPGSLYGARIIGEFFDDVVSFTTPVATTTEPESDSSDAESEAPLTELSRLEIRVGKVIECTPHPDADTLYVGKVDVGEPEPRTIVSGLVKFVPVEDMLQRSVVVLCNLKPRVMRGVTSHGMLLCASDEEHTTVDPLAAPADAPLGELVTFKGHQCAPIEPGNRATKAFDRIAESLRTDEQGIAKFDDVEFATSAGPCVSPKCLVGSVS